MSDRAKVLKNSYKKLDSMPLSFGLPVLNDSLSDADIEKYIGGDLDDALREMGHVTTDEISVMSKEELYTEIRTVYYVLKRFKNSASVFFKFSTAVDGKTVDKSMIPKMIGETIKELDDDFRKWRRSGQVGNTGSQWNMISTVATGSDE